MQYFLQKEKDCVRFIQRLCKRNCNVNKGLFFVYECTFEVSQPIMMSLNEYIGLIHIMQTFRARKIMQS